MTPVSSYVFYVDLLENVNPDRSAMSWIASVRFFGCVLLYGVIKTGSII